MAGEPTTKSPTYNIGEGQNIKAVLFMLAAVMFLSFIPLLITRSGGAESPFLFNAGWRLGIAVGCLLTLFALYRPILLNRAALALAARSSVSWAIFGTIVNSFSYALFAWSIQFVDVSIAAILLEIWPIGFILLTAWLLRAGNGYRKNIRAILPLMAVALAGFGFVVASQAEVFSLDSLLFSASIVGVGLALLGALANAFGAFPFVWGRDLVQKLPVAIKQNIGDATLIFFGTILGYAIGNFFGAALNTAIGLSFGETIALEVLTTGIISGLLLHAPASMLLRKANLITNNLGINALAYGIPIVSLLWLAIFSEIGVVRPDFLVIGAAAIVTANLLINFNAERLLGFKALVISLWGCGTAAYLRDQFDWWAAWAAKSGGYFDVLVLSATVFALILSFRTARLSGRIQEENDRGFALFEELAELERQGVIAPESRISGKVLTINRREGRELAAAYTQAHRSLNAALAQAQGADRERLVTAIVELNRLAHSRQRGTNFGEICALFLLAGMVVGIALFSRPAEVSGLTGFLVEMFAMLFPAVILFLGFNVLDLERERRSRILEPDPEKGGYRAALGETAAAGAAAEPSNRRTVEQWISIGVGGALIVAYAGLFLHKWGLWEQLMAAATGFLP